VSWASPPCLPTYAVSLGPGAREQRGPCGCGAGVVFPPGGVRTTFHVPISKHRGTPSPLPSTSPCQAHSPAGTGVCTCWCIHARMHACTHTHTFTHIHAHACTHTRAHTHTHTHIRTHTCTHLRATHAHTYTGELRPAGPLGPGRAHRQQRERQRQWRAHR